ncbi:MAG: ABC transporter permease [Alphaproteobacteria bacterium]|nr:ABC transporter permease [Alphaproteobacteria bacterium]
MTLAGLTLAQLRERWFANTLHVLMLAIGVAAATALLLFTAQTEDRLSRDARGIDLVVGAKGSPLQLVLSSVFHADVPTGNVSYADYERLTRDPRIQAAIPLGLGDTMGGSRIVGTTPAFLPFYGASVAEGRMFAAPMETVLGAETARRLGARLGQTFPSAHGLGEGGDVHEHGGYVVVGVLAPTGTVLDRLALTSLESVWKVHDVSMPVGNERIGGLQGPALRPPAPAPLQGDPHRHDDAHDHGAPGAPESAMAMKEVTAVLVRTRSPIAGPRLKREINQTTALLAARPADEAARLFSLVGAGAQAFRLFAYVFIAAAALSVFATLLASLTDRRGDIALLRTMGATRLGVFGVLLGQGLVIAGLGVALGLGLGHGLLHAAAQVSAQARGLGITGAMIHPGEIWIVIGGLGAGALAALIPALDAYRTDIAKTLAEA